MAKMIERDFNEMKVPPGYTPETYAVAINDMTTKDRRYFDRYPKRYIRVRFAEPVEQAEYGADIVIVRKLKGNLRARFPFLAFNDRVFSFSQEMLSDLVDAHCPNPRLHVFNGFQEHRLDYRIVGEPK